MEMNWKRKLRGVYRREESRVGHQDLVSSLRMKVEREKRLELMVCCRAGDRGIRLGAEEGSENVYLIHWSL